MINIKTQKRLLYIPIINISLLFIWIYNSSKINIKPIQFLKSLGFILKSIVVYSLYLIFIYFFPNLSRLGIWITIYIIAIIIGKHLIKYQSKFIE